MDPVVVTYALYLAISIALTVWVARTLFRSGQRFLVDVFGGDGELAASVNHLLVVGFYLVNLGYVCLALKVGYDLAGVRQGIEVLAGKVGVVMLVLGAMHFFNLVVFRHIRASHVARERTGEL